MSHIPMHIDYDDHQDWVTTQLRTSRNVEHSLFNDWWSGHLNFQIEHQSVLLRMSCVVGLWDHIFETFSRHFPKIFGKLLILAN